MASCHRTTSLTLSQEAETVESPLSWRLLPDQSLCWCLLVSVLSELSQLVWV